MERKSVGVGVEGRDRGRDGSGEGGRELSRTGSKC